MRLTLYKQRGAGLIEVLIALVITAFSLLGLAGLQMTALRHQKVAHYRAMAFTYSHNLAERVRSNLRGAREGFYSPVSQHYPPLHSGQPETPTCAIAFVCTHAEIAAIDIHEWRIALRDAMIGGWGEISGSPMNGFVIMVYFRESAIRTGAAPNESKSTIKNTQCRSAALNPVTDHDVRCFTMLFTP